MYFCTKYIQVFCVQAHGQKEQRSVWDIDLKVKAKQKQNPCLNISQKIKITAHL